MAVFLGDQGDVISTRSVTNLVAEVKERMAGRLAYLHTGEDLDLYRGLRDRIALELAREQDFSARFESVMGDLALVWHPDQLSEVDLRFRQIRQEHFSRRGSAVAVHSMGKAFHDLFMEKALFLAEEEISQSEQPNLSCSILTSGKAGRKEFTFTEDSPYFLVFQETRDRDAGYYEALRYQLLAILGHCGFLPDNRYQSAGDIWVGDEKAWQKWVLEQAKRIDRLGEVLALLGDLRCVAGDEGVGASAGSFAAGALRTGQGTEAYIQTIKKLSSVPVALGIFGNFKTQRSGRHRGEFDLQMGALVPLVMNMRILSTHYGVAETGTIGRIKELLNGGHLGVDLSDRLLKAYHVFTTFMLRMEADGKNDASGYYLDPDRLNDDDEYLLKGGLEAVLNLQKIVYQVFSGQE